MKSITTIVTIMSLLMISGTISAQSLKDILKSSAVKDAISSVTGINIPSDVTILSARRGLMEKKHYICELKFTR